MLRLLRPETPGQGPAPPRRRKWTRADPLMLTEEEVRHFRASMANAARAYGGTDVLAVVMGVPVRALYATKSRRPSAILAIRLASAAGSTVEAVLSGRLEVAKRAPSGGGR